MTVGVALVSVALASAVGVLTEGVGAGLFMGVLSAVAGAIALWVMPEVKPPDPTSVTAPATGSSPQVRRRRYDEGIAVLVVGLPLAGAALLLAAAADTQAVRVIGLASALALIAWFGTGFALVALSGPRLDRIRRRHHDRVVARLIADREFWERHVEPAAEREKAQRLGKLTLAFLFWPIPAALIMAPWLVAAESGSTLVAIAGMMVSLALLAALVVSSLRHRRERAHRDV